MGAIRPTSPSLPRLVIGAVVVAGALTAVLTAAHAATPGQLQTLSQAVASMGKRLALYKERRQDLATKMQLTTNHVDKILRDVGRFAGGFSRLVNKITKETEPAASRLKVDVENLAASHGSVAENVRWVKEYVNELEKTLLELNQKNKMQDETIQATSKEQELIKASLIHDLDAAAQRQSENLRNYIGLVAGTRSRMLHQQCWFEDVLLNLTGTEMAEVEVDTVAPNLRVPTSVFCAITSINSTIGIEQGSNGHGHGQGHGHFAHGGHGGHGGKHQRKDNSGFTLTCDPGAEKITVVAIDDSRSELDLNKMLTVDVRVRACSTILESV